MNSNQPEIFTFNHLKFNYQAPKKWRKYLVYALITLVGLIILMVITMINVRYANNGRFGFKELFYVFSTNNLFNNNKELLAQLPLDHNNPNNHHTFGSSGYVDLEPIKKAVWVSLASAVAGIGFAIAGSITQGLTNNPIADPTTFGITESAVFGAVVMNVLVGNLVHADIYQYVFLSFVFLGGAIAIWFILLIIKSGGAKKNHYLKITLVGLAIGIFFRTINFLLRSTNADAQKTALAAALGGGENMYSLYSSQYSILYLGLIFMSIALVLAVIFGWKLTVLELGENKAAALGVNTKIVKVVGLIIVLISVPVAVSLVGNVAFVGLFAPHVIRMLLRTRSYSIIIPLSALLGAITLSLGLTLHILYRSIPSSIYMVFIGAPMLIYLGWTQKG